MSLRKSLFICIVFTYFLNPQGIYAQYSKIDSLNKILEDYSADDSSKADKFNELAYLYHTNDIDSSLLYARKALKLSKKLNYLEGIAKSIRLIGVYHTIKSNYPAAIEYAHKSLRIYENLNDLKGISDCYNSLGIIYQNWGNYSKSLKYYQKALKILEGSKHIDSYAYCLNNIGVIYHDLGYYEKALNYYNRTIEFYNQLNDRHSLSIGLNNIGEIFMMNKEFAKAQDYFQRSYQISQEVGDSYGIAYINMDFGKLFLLKKEFSEALNYALKGLEFAKECEYIDIQKDIQLLLADIYKQLHNYKKAYESFVLYKELSDSIFNEEKFNRIAGLEYQYKYEKEKQAAELKQKNKDMIVAEYTKRQRLIRNFFIIVTALLLLLFIILIRNYFQNIKNNKQLSSQKEELEIHRNRLEQLVKERTSELEKAKDKAEESDRLKSSFLANMSHEIRTPLNSILGYSDLICNTVQSDENKKTLIANIYQSSNTLMKLIDDIIDIAEIESGQIKIAKENCSAIKLFENVNSVYDEETLSYMNKQIKFTVDYPENDIILHTDPLRIHQILVNLVDNALKFTEHGEVKIGLQNHSEENSVTFFVKDTGIGLTKEKKEIIFRRFSKIEEDKKKIYRGAGLGLAISKSLVELLSGKIWCESELNKGSVFFFTIPFNKQDILNFNS